MSDERMKRGADEIRRQRQLNEEPTREPREANAGDPVRKANSLLELAQESRILPQIPDTADLHFFWATEKSEHDSVERRLRMGYEFATPDDVKHAPWAMSGVRNNEGELSGHIKVNEMVLLKVDRAAWLELMQKVHHDDPASFERGMFDQFGTLADQLKARGSRLTRDEGFSNYGKGPSQGYFEPGAKPGTPPPLTN